MLEYRRPVIEALLGVVALGLVIEDQDEAVRLPVVVPQDEAADPACPAWFAFSGGSDLDHQLV